MDEWHPDTQVRRQVAQGRPGRADMHRAFIPAGATGVECHSLPLAACHRLRVIGCDAAIAALDPYRGPLLSCLPMDKTRREPDATAVRGFPPLADARARVLVLGSMPGVASLRAQQYYGHPRNAFWPIMASLFGFDAAAPYAQRVAALLEHRVAVWDVLAACVRPGSLDADIDARSIEVNDFAALFVRLPELRRVCCNGAKAYALFRSRVLPRLACASQLELVQLPSTSPAHAGMALEAKLHLWREALL